MHPQARQGFRRMAGNCGIDLDAPMRVLDLGGQDVNGTVHDLMPNATIDVLDIHEGKGVTIVADARTYQPEQTYDAVISTELFEHLADWHLAIATAHKALRRDGVLILTAAAPPRGPHGADGQPFPPPGEHYENVDPQHLHRELAGRFRAYGIEYRPHPADVYAWARA